MRFLFVDRIVQLIPGQTTRGIKHVTLDDPYLCRNELGKFCFIPSLIGEALGQLAAWNVMLSNDFTQRPVAGVVSSATLHRPAYVGETLLLESHIDALDDVAVRYHGVARVADEVVFSIESALGPLLPMASFVEVEDVRRQFSEIDRPGPWPYPDTSNQNGELLYNESDIRTVAMQFDRILSSEPGIALCAEKRISRAAPYFPDHFPNKPVLPMTVLLQCKLNLVAEFLKRAPFTAPYQVTEMRKIKMNEFVYPGDVVVCYLKMKQHDENEMVLSFRSEVAGKRVCVLDVVLTSKGLLQIPFGMLSDRFGRKPILTIGLILFVSGSLLGALTHSIYGMIFARTLQGTGAIGSVLIALLADLTPDEQRTKAMAVIGVTIGLSFSLAMVLSPAITHYFGLSGIFYVTAILALLGLILLHAVIPTPIKEPFHLDSEANPAQFKEVLTNKHLQRLNVSIFCQHLILTSTFFAIPILLQQQVHLGNLITQWHFYLPILVLSFIAMVPIIVLAEKKRLVKPVFLLCTITIGLSQLVLSYASTNWSVICGMMFAYFIGFNILEATVPSLVSKQASTKSKGTAMGIYSSFQFMGIFAGGALAGILYQHIGMNGIFLLNAVISLLWFILVWHMEPNVYEVTLILKVPKNIKINDRLREGLLTLNGIKEVILAAEEQVAYLRVDRSQYKDGSAHTLLDNYLD